MKTIWKPVTELPHYEVSNTGLVRNSRGQILKGQIIPNGYHVVFLYSHQVCHPRYVHRLVAQEFIGYPPTEYHEVNHKDLNKTNNVVSNLEWVTKTENRLHELKMTGRQGSIVSSADVAQIRRDHNAGVPNKTLAQRYKVSPQSITSFVKGRRRAAA